MSATRLRTVVRLAAAAESDYCQIVGWTAREFGAPQARRYARTLDFALAALSGMTRPADARPRDDIADGLWSLHVARQGRKGRHLVLFRERLEQDHRIVEVLRLLHDAMDLARHLPPPVHR